MKRLVFWEINDIGWWSRYYLTSCACILLCLLITGCERREIICRPTPASVPKLSIIEAKKTITLLWEKNRTRNPRIKFKRQFVELTYSGEDGCPLTWKWLFLPKADPYVEKYNAISHTYISAKISEGGITQLGCNHEFISDGTIFWSSVSDATDFVNAFYVLKLDAGTIEEASFADKAKKYHEMPVKPALPESVQRCRIMAEDAFQNKEFEKAVDYYEQGLEIEPLWPEGQFNAALLYGELKDYENAALNMRRYLELVPDAKDAKEAREKIYLWEGKAKEAVKK